MTGSNPQESREKRVDPLWKPLERKNTGGYIKCSGK